jgi:hypothetical protein
MNETFARHFVDRGAADFIDRVKARLDDDGLVTFGGVSSEDQALSLANSLGSIYHHRDSDEHGITRLVAKDDLSPDADLRGFSPSELLPHTDRSGVAAPPGLIILVCQKPAPSGGATILADGLTIYRHFSRFQPDALEALSAPRSAVFGGSDPLYIGSVFAPLEDGRVYTRFRADGLGYYSAPILSAVTKLQDAISQFTTSFLLGAGEGYIVQNGRWFHGRTTFSGSREVLRVLVEEGDGHSMTDRRFFGFLP